MTLEGAIKFYEGSTSTIYTMNSPETGQYCAVIPNDTNGELSMLVDMNMKSLFDSLMSNTITKDALIEKINEEYKYISNTYPHGMLILPMMDTSLLQSAINNSDKQKMFDETKKIGGITSEIYNKLTKAGVEKSKINQKIMIVETNEYDAKFVNWLKEQMPNFVDGVSLEELKGKVEESAPVVEQANPFASINPFTGETETSAVEPVIETPEQKIEEVKIEEPQVVTEESQPITPSNDIFGPDSVENKVSPVVEPIQTPEPTPVAESNNIFGAPVNEQPAQNDVFASSTSVTSEPVQPIVEPQPVQSTSLENTTVIPTQPQPAPEVTQQPVSQEIAPTEEVELNKKSGGFANLLILLVILIGVTIVSIELGKFLYNTYGV